MKGAHGETGVARDPSTFPGFASYVGAVDGRVVCEIRVAEGIADDEAIALADLVTARVRKRPRLKLV